jgi:hypothetical protein
LEADCLGGLQVDHQLKLFEPGPEAQSVAHHAGCWRA